MYSLIDLQLMFKNDYKLAQFMSRARENQVYVGNRCIRIGERLYAEHIDEGIQLMDDALKRAIAYSKAGSDCIMIHSKDKDPKKIFEFSKKFLKTKHFKPLIAVPSSYSKTYEKQLIKNGFKIVIYANHMLRAAHASMIDTAKKILIHNRGYEAEKNITSIKDIIELVEN